MVELLYDGSWDGFLTAVFEAFVLKGDVDIQNVDRMQEGGLFDVKVLETDRSKADRVAAGIERLGTDVSISCYSAWLSERDGIENDILCTLRLGFKEKRNPLPSREVDCVRKTALASRAVGFEAHRLKGLLRLHHIDGNLYGADFGHDYNILPLVAEHFHDRFRDQRLVIRDTKRRIAIVSDQSGWDIRPLPEGPITPLPEDGVFEELWKHYFIKISNPARINLKLQQKFVPKKYRKFLVEFAPMNDELGS